MPEDDERYQRDTDPSNWRSILEKKQEDKEMVPNWQRITEELHNDAYTVDEDPDFPRIEVECWDDLLLRTTKSSLRPPIHPDDMRSMLKLAEFTNGADMVQVGNIFEMFFNRVSQQATKLILDAPRAPRKYSSHDIPMSWDSDQICIFSRALPCFSQCGLVSLVGHLWTNRAAVETVAAGLGCMAALKIVQRKDADLIQMQPDVAKAFFDSGSDRWLDAETVDELKRVSEGN